MNYCAKKILSVLKVLCRELFAGCMQAMDWSSHKNMHIPIMS